MKLFFYAFSFALLCFSQIYCIVLPCIMTSTIILPRQGFFKWWYVISYVIRLFTTKTDWFDISLRSFSFFIHWNIYIMRESSHIPYVYQILIKTGKQTKQKYMKECKISLLHIRYVCIFTLSYIIEIPKYIKDLVKNAISFHIILDLGVTNSNSWSVFI